MTGTQRSGAKAIGRILAGVLGAGLLPVAGCHSAFIEATLVNHSGGPLRLVEVDYPSVSFGTELLAPGMSFHYRFKVIGEGPLKLSWTDAKAREHTEEGPRLHEGQQGVLTVTVGSGQLAWQTTFR